MKGNKSRNWALSPSNAVYHFGASGISVATATAITHPLGRESPESYSMRLLCNTQHLLMANVYHIQITKWVPHLAYHEFQFVYYVLKVRLQMQLVGGRGPLNGMGRIFVEVVKKEGPKSLYLGLMPALTRSVLYGGLRLGLYEPSKYVCKWAFGSTNLLLKIASGVFSGALATALTNPMEVLKVRLQMKSNSRRGAIGEMCKIISEEGIKALWKGVGPAMVRAGALTASQLATYDETKQILMRWTPLEEGFHLHLMYNSTPNFFFFFRAVTVAKRAYSSTVAGGLSTLITAPMDMIKTRLMLQRESKVAGNYKNGFHCAYQVSPLFLLFLSKFQL
ncbi:Mitochondrial substrate carrier family protein ucpB [Vitis vinifera]|uniref:Mitochondrial substrate carrier family protein ucpB n=1 Tax=Vitis vinifera TaxID=29760 RepID=A0A438F4X2_VITVI|nr:Mitochondrial substrate carrier family protein ucpB [Vitis vinifera]